MSDKLDKALALSNWIVDHIDELSDEELREMRGKVKDLMKEYGEGQGRACPDEPDK